MTRGTRNMSKPWNRANVLTEEQEKLQDVIRIRTPDLWPLKPCLPMKKRPGYGEFGDSDYHGVIVQGFETVVLVVLYPDFQSMSPQDIMKIPTKRYESVEKLVEEWTID